MERVVPARKDERAVNAPPAGPGREAEEPVVDGEALPSADEDHGLIPSEEAEGPTAPADVPDTSLRIDEPVEPERMKARDLIAPSRHETPVEEPESEVATKHADVIAFANQKGGVAKTTTTLNLAVAFAETGHRVLCIDLDPQGNLTMSQGIDPDKVEKSLYDVLVNDMPISEIIQHREIDIAVSSIDLAGAEIAMSTKIGRERSLQKALKEVSADYDFICIDTPPSLGLLTINALTAATKVIVPVQCEYLSMRGLVQLQNTLKMIQENLNPEVRIEGILPTMLDARTVHAKEAVEILEENFGDLVFRSRIRKAIKFAEAPVKGSSVLKYDPEGNAASYYRELAKEVLANESA
jgi:chromosome partitioning protein